MICKTCGAKIDGTEKFCMECGTPVPQFKKCLKCGIQLPVASKFCPECGSKQNASENSLNNAEISIGDKNVIAGDVIGKKENFNIGGNATFINDVDETKKIAKCHICGSVVQRIQGYDCPVCKEFTCENCYNIYENSCKKCCELSSETKIQQYNQKLKEILADGKINFSERQELIKLQTKLNLDNETVRLLEEEFRKNSISKEFTTVETISFEKAEALFYEEKDSKKAFDFIEPLYNNHSTNEKILDLYFQILSEVKPEEVTQIKQKLPFDNLQLDLALVRIAIKNNDLNNAERILNSTERMWNNNFLVKCHRIFFTIGLYEQLDAEEWFSKAEEYFVELGTAGNKVEAFWFSKIQNKIDSIKNAQTVVEEIIENTEPEVLQDNSECEVLDNDEIVVDGVEALRLFSYLDELLESLPTEIGIEYESYIYYDQFQEILEILNSVSSEELGSVKMPQFTKDLLLFLDGLLESLPEEKIVEFAKSNEFVIYKKFFAEFNI